MKTRWILRALPAVVILSGCSRYPTPRPTLAPSACVVAGAWTDPATGRRRSGPAVLAHAARARIVLLGERHDVAEDHRWQLDVLAGLAALREHLVVGFEAFSRRDQPTLETWARGGLSVDDLPARSPDLYLPLLHFTRRHRMPTVALNVERDLVARVGRTGWAQVPPSDRHGVSDPAPPAPAYVERLLTSYADHTCRSPATVRGTPGFARFVEAQLLWDRAMAEALAAAASGDENALVVGIVGSGHLEHGYGIPHQLAALGWRHVVVLLPWDVATACADMTPGLADAVFGIAPLAAEAPAPARHRCESSAPTQAPPR